MKQERKDNLIQETKTRIIKIPNITNYHKSINDNSIKYRSVEESKEINQ